MEAWKKWISRGLARSRKSARWESMIECVAQRSEPAIWRLVEGRAGSLSAAQARGYIRARGQVIVQRELFIAQGTRPDSADKQPIADAILERIVDRIMAKTHPERLAA